MAIEQKALDAAKDLFKQLDVHWEGDKPDQGMNRKGWSCEETNAMRMMTTFAHDELDMDTYEDLAGNQYTVSQRHHNHSNAVRMSGSHLDAVKNGGRYDGTAGVIAPLIAMYQNKLNGDKPNQPVVIPMWRNEESPWLGQFGVGSKFATAQLSADFLKTAMHTAYNIPLIDLMGANNLDLHGEALLKKIESDDPRLINTDLIEAAIETHIEQGLELEKANKSLGIVTAIRGNIRFPDMIDFVGEEGHTGTVPQDDRKSAMMAMARFMVQCDDIFKGHEYRGFDIVWDFPEGGSVNGKATTLSGHARLKPEVRSTDKILLQHASANFECVAQRVEKETGVKISINKMTTQQPTQMSSVINAELVKNANRLSIDAMEMPSGAGHDIMMLGQNTGLIFIRHNGLSHRPDELLSRNKDDTPFTIGSDFANACDLNRLFLLGTAQPKAKMDVSFTPDLRSRGARQIL